MIDLPAGPELDRMIAKAMGWDEASDNDHQHGRHFEAGTWSYWLLTSGDDAEAFSPSVYMAHAWMVVDYLRHQGFRFHMQSMNDGTWIVHFIQDGWPTFASFDQSTPELCICHAALAYDLGRAHGAKAAK